MTTKELSELYNISTDSLNKYARSIGMRLSVIKGIGVVKTVRTYVWDKEAVILLDKYLKHSNQYDSIAGHGLKRKIVS